VVDLLDATGEEVAVESVAVKHLSPTALSTLAERVRKAQEKAGKPGAEGSLLANPNTQSVVIVAPPSEVASWKALLEEFDRAESIVTAHYTPRRFSLAETSKLIQETVLANRGVEGAPASKVVLDELTGTLIVTASWSQQEAIRELLDRLEATPAESRRALRAFPVKHRDVGALLDILRDLLDEGGLLEESAAGSNAATAQEDAEGISGPLATTGTGGRVVSSEEEGGMGVTLTQDVGTNRIVAVGPPRVLDQLSELVAELDVQSPQVLVEAMIVSLTEAQTRDLGVELQKGFRRDELFFRLQSLFGLGSPDPSASSLAQVPGTGFTSVVLDPGSFSGVLRALATVNDGRSLTIPKVLVNNNEQANLNSILQTPYTSTSLSTSTSITSFGGTLDAGTTIAVKPQITDGDMMLLEYSVSLSSFVGESADASVPPPRQETSLSSVASVPDGYAVIIGGLEIESEGDSVSKIPLLGDIPLIGTLFRSQSKSNSRSRFFVFLRCSVMRSSMFEDLKYVSRRDLEVAGVETGAPEVRPLIMR
jgi:general secretion pathway protein D